VGGLPGTVGIVWLAAGVVVAGDADVADAAELLAAPPVGNAGVVACGLGSGCRLCNDQSVAPESMFFHDDADFSEKR